MQALLGNNFDFVLSIWINFFFNLIENSKNISDNILESMSGSNIGGVLNDIFGSILIQLPEILRELPGERIIFGEVSGGILEII